MGVVVSDLIAGAADGIQQPTDAIVQIPSIVISVIELCADALNFTADSVDIVPCPPVYAALIYDVHQSSILLAQLTHLVPSILKLFLVPIGVAILIFIFVFVLGSRKRRQGDETGNEGEEEEEFFHGVDGSVLCS